MLIMVLLTPLTMFGFGTLFSKGAPADINSVYGYRTKNSKKSHETWEYAHRLFGKFWKIEGLITFPLSLAAMIFCYGKSIDFISRFGLIILLVQCVILFIPVIRVEHDLKKLFDRDGNRKQ